MWYASKITVFEWIGLRLGLLKLANQSEMLSVDRPIGGRTAAINEAWKEPVQEKQGNVDLLCES